MLRHIMIGASKPLYFVDASKYENRKWCARLLSHSSAHSLNNPALSVQSRQQLVSSVFSALPIDEKSVAPVTTKWNKNTVIHPCSVFVIAAVANEFENERAMQL